MSFGEACIVAGSLLVLFFAGWVSLSRSVFRDLGDQDSSTQVQLMPSILMPSIRTSRSILIHKSHVGQVLFALVFAFSVNLVQLVLFEILGVLSYR
jgi:hypothetical protein